MSTSINVKINLGLIYFLFLDF